MGKPNVRYVCKSYGGGWRIWNRKTKSWWGIKFPVFPELLIAELNGPKRPLEIERLTNLHRNGAVR